MSDPVWSFLDTLRGYTCAQFEWEMALSHWDQFPIFQKHYLLITHDQASSIDCPTDCGFGCPRQVVVHAGNNVYALCPEKIAIPVQLEPRNVCIYKLNQRSIHRAICQAMGVFWREEKLVDLIHTWRLGDYIPTAGVVFPLFITMPDSQKSMNDIVQTLCLKMSCPFILMAPTRRYVSTAAQSLLFQRECIFLAINEELSLMPSAEFKRHREMSSIVPVLENTSQRDKDVCYFPTPSHMTWSDITIAFRDGHTVSIKAGQQKGRFNYTQMGMVNRKNGDPTVQWKLLLAFAQSHGEIDWKNRYSSLNLKKQKQQLSQCLKDFFRLETDPIEWDEETKTYRCRFRILPEGDEI